jgi:hypothetical protein
MNIYAILVRHAPRKQFDNIYGGLAYVLMSGDMSIDVQHASAARKKKRLKYGHLPPKEAKYKPWQHLCVDTIRPYRIRRKGTKDLVFQAVTFMDPATCWFELKQTKTKQADEVANLVEQTWLSRYP